MTRPHEPDDEMRKRLAETLRSAADDLESDDLRLTNSPRISYVETVDGLPAELELEYFDRDSGRERTIEIY